MHVEKEFGHILYEKYLYYMGSVLENTKERRGKTLVQLPFYLSKEFGKQLENVKNYPKCENIFRTFLYDDLRIEALKEKFKKQYESYKQLRQLSDLKLEEFSFEEMFLPFDHFDLKQKYAKLEEISGEEILEKYVILYYLVPNEFLAFIENDVDYFKKTIFSKNIKESFPTKKILISKLIEIFEPYKKKFVELHNYEVERIMETDSVNEDLLFSNDFQKRKKSLIANKRKPNYVKYFIQNKSNTFILLNTIFNFIQKKLIKQFENKEIDISFLIEFKKFLSGEINEYNLSLAKKYFVETNTEMNFFKLSTKFENEQHILVKQLIKKFLDFPRNIISKNEKELIDFQDYHKNLDQIIKDNENDLLVDGKGNFMNKDFDINNPNIHHPKFKEHAYDLVKKMEREGFNINSTVRKSLKIVEDFKKR